MYVTCIVGGEHEECTSVLVREPGRMFACSWEGNIQVGLKGMDFDGVNWIELAHDRVCCLILMNMVMNLHFKLRNISI
jgi:hypothetical protein